MTYVNDHYLGIMAFLGTLIVFFTLAVIAALGLYFYYRLERIWANHVRRIKHEDIRVPGAFRTRPWRP
jgi:hypothetical protein